jgi:hypothetical protein
VSYYLKPENGEAASPAKSNQVFIICAVQADGGGGASFTPSVSEASSCTLTQLGGITVPFACGDVPIIAGVALFMLVVVLWLVRFK